MILILFYINFVVELIIIFVLINLVFIF